MATSSTPIGDADAQLATPFPSLGGNVLLNPRGRLRGYVELTGFPSVTVDDYTGWKTSFVARAEIFVTDRFGIYAGYRTYKIDLEDRDLELDFSVRWRGLLVGGAVRF